MVELAILNGLVLAALAILPRGEGRRPREDRRLAKELLRQANAGRSAVQAAGLAAGRDGAAIGTSAGKRTHLLRHPATALTPGAVALLLGGGVLLDSGSETGSEPTASETAVSYGVPVADLPAGDLPGADRWAQERSCRERFPDLPAPPAEPTLYGVDLRPVVVPPPAWTPPAGPMTSSRTASSA